MIHLVRIRVTVIVFDVRTIFNCKGEWALVSFFKECNGAFGVREDYMCLYGADEEVMVKEIGIEER